MSEIQKDIKVIDLKNYDLDIRAVEKISESLAKKHMLIPIKIIDENSLLIATNDPLNMLSMDDIEITTHMRPIPILAELKDIREAINIHYGSTKAISIAAEFEKELEEKKKKNGLKLEYEQSELDISNSPAVKLVNTIIDQAIIKNASDIHIEPFDKYLRIRIRIDGQLHEILRTDISTLNGIVSRIKILGKMNIAERRIPQDGRIGIKFEDIPIDLRVSILPTIYGEKVVIRLIYNANTIISKENIGFFKEDLHTFNKLLMNTNGIILLTGPTGSGKSTTLASAVKDLNKENINIVTVEDPVENIIDGVNQIHVNSKAGLDFPQLLRSILRQDPDIVMIGEIRDCETVDIAIRAAITGHLVLSTLHTNDAVSSISRLIDMGIEPYMVASAVRGVVAQRLVRQVCKFCAKEIEISIEDSAILKIPMGTKIKKAIGCKQCENTGYKGRFAVHEIFMITSQIRQMIAKNISDDDLKKTAIKNGMYTLWDNTLKNVLNGKTTLEELYRVAYIQD